MALQPKLGILAQRRDRNDSLDCVDSLAARVCVGMPVIQASVEFIHWDDKRGRQTGLQGGQALD